MTANRFLTVWKPEKSKNETPITFITGEIPLSDVKMNAFLVVSSHERGSKSERRDLPTS